MTKTKWAEKKIYIKMTLNKHFLPIFYYPTMDSSSTKRSSAPLTDNEKLLIINVYNYFLGTNSKREDHQKVTLCKRIAEVLSVRESRESTVGRMVSDWKSHRDNIFTPYKTLRHPKLQPDENISEILHTKILDANKKAELLSIHTLRQFLAEKGYGFSK
jgi:hypothetical protein